MHRPALHAQQQYLFYHLGIRDGLVANSTTGLQQDAKGYIWIATLQGLERYDGRRFVLFHHKEEGTNSLPNDMVMNIRLDKKNRLWVLCQYNKLGYIDLDEMRYHEVRVDMPDSILSRAQSTLYIDRPGNTLLLLGHIATLAYNENTRTFSTSGLPFMLPKGWTVNGIIEDSTTRAYYLATDSGLAKYDPIHHTLSYRDHNTDHDPVIACFAKWTYTGSPFIDASSRFWLGSWPPGGYGNSIFTFDRKTGKSTPWHNSLSKMLHNQYHEIHGIHQQKDGTLWMIGINTLAVLRKNSNDFEPVQTKLEGEFGLYYDIVQDLLEDREGNIWLATDKGIYEFNPSSQKFRTIPNKRAGKDSIYTPDVTDVLQISNGDIIVATWGSGIFSYDSAFHPVDRWYIRQYRQLQQDLTWCIHERPNGDIWTGQQHGSLVIIHPATRAIEKLKPAIFGNSTIRQIAEDNRGNLWLGTQAGDLIKWDPASNTFSIVQKLHSEIIRLYIDWKGNLWACTRRNGLFHIRPSDGAALSHYTSEGPETKRLTDIGAADIVQLSDSLYAIAANKLCLLNIYTGLIRPAQHGGTVPFEGITNIARDKKGYLWITTQTGLCKLNTHNEVRSSFNEMDGIGSNAFNPASGGLLKDGRIAFGTVHDMIVFQPSDITGSSQQPPDVEISNIAVLNKWLPMDSVRHLPELELPYGDNSIRIAFSTLAYQNSFAVTYQMEGLDKNWVTAQNSEAFYSYLPPGRYTFRIVAHNAEDSVSPHTRELHIYVKSPFWRTWWFLSFLLLLGAALLYWLDRQRMQRKAVMEKMRSNISGNLHQEVNKALQNINVLSEIARIKAEKDPEQSINYINEIHHQSHNMIISLDDMLWSIDPSNDTMDRAIDRMKEFAGALSRRHGTRIGVEADDTLRALKPDMTIRHEVVLIYKLALRLLAEEMKVAGILVQLDYQRPHLHLTLFSAGASMDERNSRSIRLMEEMKTRAHNVRGTLEIHYDEKGTAILFICPSTF